VRCRLKRTLVTIRHNITVSLYNGLRGILAEHISWYARRHRLRLFNIWLLGKHSKNELIEQGSC